MGQGESAAFLQPPRDDSTAITFEMQKKDQKNATVIHGRTEDSVLCSVLLWARLVSRIWTYPGASLDTPMCTVGKMVTWNTPYPIPQHPSALRHSMWGNWKCSSWLQASQDRHTLPEIRSSNGDVSWRNPCLHHHAHWQVVEQHLFNYIRKQVEQFLLDTSPTLLLKEFHLMTPVNVTTATMPGRAKMLDTTSHDWCSCQHSLSTLNWQIRWCNTISWRSTFLIAKGVEGRENWEIKFSISPPTSKAHLVHFFA